MRSERPKGKSSFVVTDNIKDAYVIQNKTKKERNRRLLLQHQDTHECPDKDRKLKRPSNSLRHVKRLQEIKEDDTRGDKDRNKHEGSQSSRANKSEKEEASNDYMRRQIKQILKRKIKRSKGPKIQTLNKTKKIRPPCELNQNYLFE